MAKNAKDFEERPWGTFDVIAEFLLQDGSDVVIKKIVVRPLKRLSYQSHKTRTENWLVVQGSGQAILDGQTVPIRTGSKIEVLIGTKHRIVNDNEQDDLIVVEISTGIFDEFDNLRHEDDFGR